LTTTSGPHFVVAPLSASMVCQASRIGGGWSIFKDTHSAGVTTRSGLHNKDKWIAEAVTQQGLRKLFNMAHRIYIANDQLLVSHLFTLLEQAGIPALMQQSVRDVPQDECGPLAWYSELWVLRDFQLASAQRLLIKALDNIESEEAPGTVSKLASLRYLTPLASSSSSSSSPPPAEIA